MTTTDPTLDVTLELITPELAVSYLENNTDNRAVTQNTVTALAELIRKGEWRITHQGIAFSPTGRLLDGQHRLWAIIEAGIPVHILVARNVPDEAFAYMDTGKKRSLADRLRLDRTVAEVVRLATAIVFGNGFSAAQAQNMHNVISPMLSYITDGRTGRKNKVTTAAVKLAGVVRALSGVEKEFVRANYSALHGQNYDNMTNALKAFNQLLVMNRISVGGYELLARAYVAFGFPGTQTRIVVTDQEALVAEIRSVLIAAYTQLTGPLTDKVSVTKKQQLAQITAARVANKRGKKAEDPG